MSIQKFHINIKIGKDDNINLTNMDEFATEKLINVLGILQDIAKQSPSPVKLELSNGSVGISVKGPDLSFLTNGIDTASESKNTNRTLVKSLNQLSFQLKTPGIIAKTQYESGSKTVDYTEKLVNSPRFKVPVKFTPKYELKFIQGYLNEVGGNNPNIHIKKNLHVSGEKEIVVDCTMEQASSRDNICYQKVYIATYMWKDKESKMNYMLLDYLSDKLYKEFSDLQKSGKDLPYSDQLVLLHDKIVEYIQSKRLTSAKKLMNIYACKHTDTNILKTILTTTRDFKSNNGINQVRNKILELYKSKIGGVII